MTEEQLVQRIKQLELMNDRLRRDFNLELEHSTKIEQELAQARGSNKMLRQEIEDLHEEMKERAILGEMQDE